MPLLKPKIVAKKVRVKLDIDEKILHEIKQYIEFAQFKDLNDFFEEAILHILSKDKDFKEWRETHMQQ